MKSKKNRRGEIMIISKKEWRNIFIYFIVISALFGTTTALWDNPIYMRKIEIKTLDYVIFAFFTILGSFHMGLENKVCKKSSVFGGVLGFVGFACPTCNAIFVLILGNHFLMNYFEPIRHYIGFIGIIILTWSLYRKIKMNNI